MLIKTAALEDAPEILALQKLAYQSEAALYNDYSIPPLIQTLPEIESDFQDQVYLKAIGHGMILGSVRGYLQDGTCYIGRLIVHPEYQNRGVGNQLMTAIEAHFSHAHRFELFTGESSQRNLYLYHKLGYQVFKTHQLTDRVRLVYLEKTVLRSENAAPGVSLKTTKPTSPPAPLQS